MARTDLLTANIHVKSANTGLNLTDAATQTMVLGADNGIETPYVPGADILLRNDTGGAAVYTVEVPTPTEQANIGLTTPDKTVSVATAKDVLLPMAAAYKQSDGNIYIDCDVAAKIAVIKSA